MACADLSSHFWPFIEAVAHGMDREDLETSSFYVAFSDAVHSKALLVVQTSEPGFDPGATGSLVSDGLEGLLNACVAAVEDDGRRRMILRAMDRMHAFVDASEVAERLGRRLALATTDKQESLVGMEMLGL